MELRLYTPYSLRHDIRTQGQLDVRSTDVSVVSLYCFILINKFLLLHVLFRTLFFMWLLQINGYFLLWQWAVTDDQRCVTVELTVSSGVVLLSLSFSTYGYIEDSALTSSM
jgi:hypothetical protein